MKFKVMLTHIKHCGSGHHIVRCESSVLAEFDTPEEAEQAIEAVDEMNTDWAKKISESNGAFGEREFVRCVRLYRKGGYSN